MLDMKKVITYGTYDLLHYGHIRLLERAKALGDYLIVGVTADDFDKMRGKINVQQSLMERIENVRATGLADEIIVEEYEGQKIDDIRRLGVDVFTVGSDWVGKFDYLKEYCEVVYLPRTEGVSSSEIRAEERSLKLGVVGESIMSCKVIRESRFVNGINVVGTYSYNNDKTLLEEDNFKHYENYIELLNDVDAVFIGSHPRNHYVQAKEAIEHGRHVLVEAPISLSEEQTKELFGLADQNKCILFEGIKTAYSTAYSRLMLLVKSGIIGRVVSVDSTCTSLRQMDTESDLKRTWNSICGWGPTAMLPVFQLLGCNYIDKTIVSYIDNEQYKLDGFSKVDFIYQDAVASIKVGKSVKSEGELIISGTNGYIYVPAPWWKTDYFEVRYEDSSENRRYFYQLEGEGIRYEIVAFLKSIQAGRDLSYVDRDISESISKIIESFEDGMIVRI